MVLPINLKLYVKGGLKDQINFIDIWVNILLQDKTVTHSLILTLEDAFFPLFLFL